MINTKISKDIWELKYQYNNETEDEFYDRPAKGLFDDLKDNELTPYMDLLGIDNRYDLYKTTSNIFRNHKGMLAGRPMYSLGTERKGQTYSNCYVNVIEKDSMSAIMETASKSAMTMKAGGGVGYSFSIIRPKYSEIKTSGEESSGVLSFMNIFNTTCGTIQSGGNRRGAQIAVLGVWHPDILEFISCKRKGDGVPDEYKPYKNFNLSIYISDAFMDAVRKDELWELVFPDTSYEKYESEWDGNINLWVANGYPVEIHNVVKARELWDSIMKSNYDFAEPGILFEDTINKYNTLWFDEYILACNPCIPNYAKLLTPYGIRNLSNINIGDKIWSEDGWVTVTAKPYRGKKEVFSYRTNSGILNSTPNHKIKENNIKIEVKDAKNIDILTGARPIKIDYNSSDIMDGIVLGDGSVHKASDNLIYLCIGTEDYDYFESEINEKIITHRPGISGYYSYEIDTTVTYDELPKTYLRKVPNRFLYGNASKKISFLRGFFTANGSVVDKGKRISLKTSSKDILNNIQLMLSSLGIKSYYTTNKSKETDFSNGSYVCRESYDVNIVSDRLIFKNMIGFIQKYKNEKINTNISTKYKKSYEIKDRISIGEDDVWDVTVDGESHTFWCDGFNISNCAEQTLPKWGSCNLGSLNASKYVMNIFEDNAEINIEDIKNATKSMIIMLDRMLDINYYPLEEQKEVAMDKRQVGLGVTGLADALAMMKIKYSSKDALHTVDDIMNIIKISAYETSIELAKKLGPFPLWNKFTPEQKGMFLNGEFIKTLPENIKKDILKYGIRNSRLLSIAPTGTISLIMNNASSGIEPIFMLEYDRKIKTSNEKTITETIETYSWRKYKEFIGNNNPKVPDFFETTNELNVDSHINMLAIVQKHVCSSVSKTINIPVDYDYEKFKEVYTKAHKMGIKGCTTYRPNSIIGSVLSKKGGNGPCAERPDEISFMCAPKRPSDLNCEIHHCNIKGTPWLVIVGIFKDIPYEIFAGEVNDLYIPKTCKEGIISKKKKGVYSLTVKIRNNEVEYKDIAHTLMTIEQRAMTRLVSLSLRHGVPHEFIVKQLSKSSGDITDFCAVINRVLKCYIKQYKYDKDIKCPECGEGHLIRQEGCMACDNGCGYSKCG